MSLPVLTAIADPRHEADLAARVHEGGGPVTVVRRCVDLADLLAAAAAGLAAVAVVSPDFRRLDQAALDRLGHCRVAVVGFAATADAERHLQRLGVARVISSAAGAVELAAAASGAVSDLDRDPTLQRILDWSERRPAFGGRTGAPIEPAEAAEPPVGAGRVAAVWGPAGSPGRTSVAVNVAAELAVLGSDVLLVDADSYGGVVGQTLGLLDESAALATACRAANAGRLDGAALTALAAPLGSRLRVLTGITRPERWPELRPGALERVLATARTIADFVVVDTGFCLEQDEELAYDTAAPRRNGATLAALAAADQVLAVAAADPLGLTRYIRALGELSALLPEADVTAVVNRVRRTVAGGGEPVRQIGETLSRHAGVQRFAVIPDDPASYDAALAAGRALHEVALRSPARRAIRDLAAQVVGAPVPEDRRSWWRRTGGVRTISADGARWTG